MAARRGRGHGQRPPPFHGHIPPRPHVPGVHLNGRRALTVEGVGKRVAGVVIGPAATPHGKRVGHGGERVQHGPVPVRARPLLAVRVHAAPVGEVGVNPVGKPFSVGGGGGAASSSGAPLTGHGRGLVCHVVHPGGGAGGGGFSVGQRVESRGGAVGVEHHEHRAAVVVGGGADQHTP